MRKRFLSATMRNGQSATPLFWHKPKILNPSSQSSKDDWEKWVPGSTAMFVVRKPKQKDLAV